MIKKMLLFAETVMQKWQLKCWDKWLVPLAGMNFFYFILLFLKYEYQNLAQYISPSQNHNHSS